VSFVIVLITALGIQVVREVGLPRITRAALPVALVSLVLLIPAWRVDDAGTLRVAAVQGNGKAGYFDRREPGDLLQAQLDATAPLFGTDVDVVLWPEGSSDYSPLDDPYTAQAFDYVAEQLSAPFVTWAVTQRGERTYNTSILWESGRGIVDYYDKKHPVPFGEYIPDRAFWRPFAPDLIDLVGREYTPGTTDMVFDIGGTKVGINICFDIVDDQLLRETVVEGAQAIFASSNNGDFGRTDESAQQLAIARIRAMETGRSVVNISTVGLSAVIAPDGQIVAQLPWYTAGTMVEDVALATTVTPAVAGGRQLEWFVSGLGLGALLVAALATRPGRRRG